MSLPLAPPADLEADHLLCLAGENGSDVAALEVVGRDFRDALGRFATGVTVLTALTPDGEMVGVTISSFNSVSLNPPLILWSLACDSPRLEAFRCTSHYVVNVLAENQEWISDTFATRDGDRSAVVGLRMGLAGVPLIEGCSAWFECSNEAQYPGGDHLIFIGRVRRHSLGEAEEPLIFHSGRYRQLSDDSRR